MSSQAVGTGHHQQHVRPCPRRFGQVSHRGPESGQATIPRIAQQASLPQTEVEPTGSATDRRRAMFQLVRTPNTIDLPVRQVPALVGSFLRASAFYEFGNFALKARAFLTTWFTLNALEQDVRVLRSRHPVPEQAS